MKFTILHSVPISQYSEATSIKFRRCIIRENETINQMIDRLKLGTSVVHVIKGWVNPVTNYSEIVRETKS